MCFIRVQVLYLYSSTDISTTLKNSCFNFAERSDFCMIDILSISVQVFSMPILTSLSVDEIFAARCVNWSTNFRSLPLQMEMTPSCLKHICIHLKQKNMGNNFFFQLKKEIICSCQHFFRDNSLMTCVMFVCLS